MTPIHGISGYAAIKLQPGAISNDPPRCSTIQSQPNWPHAAGEMASNALCVAIISTPKRVTYHVGRKTSAANTTIDQPMAQSTAAAVEWKSKLNPQPRHFTQVISKIASQSPRLKRNQESSRFVRPRPSDRNAPVPARKMNTGAQKCVIQRVRNSAPDVFVKSVGSYGTLVKK